MSRAVIVHGRYVGRTFIADGPLPDIEGEAELVIAPTVPKSGKSIADDFGTAPVQRSGDEILAEIRADREEWGDR